MENGIKSEDSDIYRRLQEHLDQMPIGFPKAKSGSDIRVLKHLFTPEEAKIATFLRFGWNRDLEPLEQIYERIKDTGISLEELEAKLDDLTKKGSILSNKKGAKKYYANAMLIVGMYEFQVNKLTIDFLKDFNEYLDEIWGAEANKTDYHQLRTIPVEKSLDPKLKVAPYDNLRKIIENSDGPFAKINCICRQEREIYGKPCKITKHEDNCLGFGGIIQTYIDQGWGTQISKDETLRILQTNQEEGLILRPSNSQDVEFICSCCSCCDKGIAGLLKVPDPVNYVVSNFYSEVDPDLCTGCGTCVDRCQIKAITLIDDISSIDRMRCIGCGNCVTICPSEAIMLQRKEEQYVPPQTMDDLYDLILKAKNKFKE
ncbi:MAG: 4Fe-4S binding protein [Promethearchaeota archaeon]